MIQERSKLKSVITEKDSAGYDPKIRDLVKCLSALSETISKGGLNSEDTRLQLSGVIESAGDVPAAKSYIHQLKTLYENVMEHPVYAKDIDPATRGPFGIAKIELKDGAQPMKKRFFKTSGE